MTIEPSTATSLAVFEGHRARLFGIAYRMLGSAADADDILQEARLRWLDVDVATVADPRAYLVTIVSRLALDQLGSARVRREQYVGPWLPEPIATVPEATAHDLSLAFLHLLERLSPAERAAFLLADVFDYSHAEVARILGKSEDACRQLAARGRKAVRAGRGRAVAPAEHARVLAAFLGACGTGDLDALVQLLAADAMAITDGGGRVQAARRIVRGGDAVARLLIGLARKGLTRGPVLVPRLISVNGGPAVALEGPDGLDAILTLELVDDRIAAVCIVRNPDKLGAVASPRAIA